nr:hypothetical protein [Tanacetum cinerariifolium]
MHMLSPKPESFYQTEQKMALAYNDMQQKIKRLQDQLGDLKGKSKDTPCESDTLDSLSQKLENENVELEFQVIPKVVEMNDLLKPITSNAIPTTTESKVVKNDKVIALGMFRINLFKISKEDKFVPINKVIAKVDNTAKTRWLQPRSNTKNDRIPSASKSSCIKNKEVEVEEHHRNLLLSKNNKHMSSECSNVKLAIGNDKSKVICAMYKQCLITFNHDIVYNRRTKKIMEKMNATFDEISTMAFEQSSSKPRLQGMTYGQISSRLDLTYAPSTITTQKLTKRELDILFEAMYDDYIGGQPSSATRTAPAAQAPQVLQTPMTSTTTADTAPIPTATNSSL